jgi:hypothetical protein
MIIGLLGIAFNPVFEQWMVGTVDRGDKNYS